MKEIFPENARIEILDASSVRVDLGSKEGRVISFSDAPLAHRIRVLINLHADAALTIVDKPDLVDVTIEVPHSKAEIRFIRCQGFALVTGIPAPNASFERLMSTDLLMDAPDDLLGDDPAYPKARVIVEGELLQLMVRNMVLQFVGVGAEVELKDVVLLEAAAFRVLTLSGHVYCRGLLAASSATVIAESVCLYSPDSLFLSLDVDDHARLILVSSPKDLTDKLHPTLLTVDHFDHRFSGASNLTISDGSRLQIATQANSLNVSGGGTLALERGARILNLVCPADGGDASPLKLVLGENAGVWGLRGGIILGDARHGTVSGGTDFTLFGIQPGADIFGLSITGFRTANILEARTIWMKLREAEFVVPIIEDTPVVAYRHTFLLHSRARSWLMTRCRRSRTASSLRQVSLEDLHAEAEYVRILASVVDSKGAPGNVRSSATWAAYRLRALTTTSRYERFLLGLYRLIGYGERPGPALSLWAVGVLVVSLSFLVRRPFSFTGTGVLEVVKMFAYWSVPSFGLLNQPELPDIQRDLGKGVLPYFIHTLLAIPFLTGVLALRNYLKADRPNR